MKESHCPLGGACGGTGWLWRGGSDYPYPEPPEWHPCKCNPRAAGNPNELLDYDEVNLHEWYLNRALSEGTPPEPF